MIVTARSKSERHAIPSLSLAAKSVCQNTRLMSKLRKSKIHRLCTRGGMIWRAYAIRYQCQSKYRRTEDSYLEGINRRRNSRHNKLSERREERCSSGDWFNSRRVDWVSFIFKTGEKDARGGKNNGWRAINMDPDSLLADDRKCQGYNTDGGYPATRDWKEIRIAEL